VTERFNHAPLVPEPAPSSEYGHMQHDFGQASVHGSPLSAVGGYQQQPQWNHQSHLNSSSTSGTLVVPPVTNLNNMDNTTVWTSVDVESDMLRTAGLTDWVFVRGWEVTETMSLATLSPRMRASLRRVFLRFLYAERALKQERGVIMSDKVRLSTALCYMLEADG
jgi:hypothetical protein